MRTIAFILCSVIGAAACNGGDEAREAIKKAQEEDLKAKKETGGVAKRIKPPVSNRAKIPCTQLIDPQKFGDAIGETALMTMEELKDDADATANCALRRGGKHVGSAEQATKIKTTARLGVLPGDEVCSVVAYCWTIEDPERMKTRCGELDKKDKIVDTLGFPACLHINMQGEDDQQSYKFFDDDTKCVIKVRPGPSNNDTALIAKCAQAAHDQIGPAQIAVSSSKP